MKIFFFQKDLQVQAIHSSKKIPVDEAKIIATDIVPEVRELDALPLALAAPFSLHAPAENFTANQLHSFQLAHHFGRQERRRVRVDNSA